MKFRNEPCLFFSFILHIYFHFLFLTSFSLSLSFLFFIIIFFFFFFSFFFLLSFLQFLQKAFKTGMSSALPVHLLSLNQRVPRMFIITQHLSLISLFSESLSFRLLHFQVSRCGDFRISAAAAAQKLLPRTKCVQNTYIYKNRGENFSRVFRGR